MADDLTFLHARHRPQCIATVDKRFDYHTLQLMTLGGVELSYDAEQYELDGAWTWPCYPGPWIRFHEHPRGNTWEHRYVRSVAMLLTTLRRGFREATGQSLHQYRLEHRVAHAKRLLGTTDEPIKQIASSLGYRDVFYFTRQFTQLTGVPPAVYRSSRQ